MGALGMRCGRHVQGWAWGRQVVLHPMQGVQLLALALEVMEALCPAPRTLQMLLSSASMHCEGGRGWAPR